jgi:hypothetical protein
LLLGVAVLLTACAATGPRFSEQAAGAAAIPSDVASLILYRLEENWPSFAHVATVLVDGKEVGVLERNAYKVCPVPPGSHRLAARVKSWSGLCETTIEASGGTRHYFLVSPWRGPPTSGEVAAGLAILPFALLPYVGPIVQMFAWSGDEALQSFRNPCGGFRVERVDEATARPVLDELPVSR